MQNFITDHEGEQVSSILKILDIYTDSEPDDLEDDGCIWVVDSTYKCSYLPRMRQRFQGYEIPSMNWEFVDRNGFRIPNGHVDVEIRKVIRSVRHGLADNYQIAVKELEKFHQKRMQQLNDQINHLTELKEEEMKKFQEFSTEWVH